MYTNHEGMVYLIIPDRVRWKNLILNVANRA